MGQIILESDVWDFIAELEIISGNNAPNNGQRIGPFSVNKGWTSQAFEDRVCYRRSANPAVAGSGFTDWRCISRIIDGVETSSVS